MFAFGTLYGTSSVKRGLNVLEPTLSIIYAICFFTILIAAAFVVYLYLWLKRQETVNKKIAEVSDLIKAGAATL